MFQNNRQTINFTLGCLNVVKMTQAQYPIEQAAWSFNLAAMFLRKALVIFCSEYLQITGNNDGAKFPKLSMWVFFSSVISDGHRMDIVKAVRLASVF